jgi:DNA-binding GntR family transcriptional regulator
MAEHVASESQAVGNASFERCVVIVRDMVLSGELLPGQKVNQAELAELSRVSRVPVREALAKLHAEGVLAHKPNTGYTVARFSREDLTEIYLMRRLLETELIRSTDLATVDVDAMITLSWQMKELPPSEPGETYQRLNHAFHFTLLDHSPLALVRSEVSRLWYMSGFYRSLYLHETTNWNHLDDEHGQIIEAVRACDVDALIRTCDEHRAGAELLVAQRLRTRRIET